MTNSRAIAEASLVLALFGIAALIFQQSATSLADQFANSGDAIENAAMYPEALAFVLIGLGLLQAIAILHGLANPQLSQESEPDQQVRQTEKGNLKKAFIASFLFIGYLLLLDPLGYHLATPLSLMILFWVLGVSPLLKAAFVAIILSLCVALFFEVLLKVVLPLGLFNLALPI